MNKKYDFFVKIHPAFGEGIIATVLLRNLNKTMMRENIDNRIIALSTSGNIDFLKGLDYISKTEKISKEDELEVGKNEILLDVSDYQRGKDVNNAIDRKKKVMHLSEYLIQEAEKQLETILEEPFKISNDGLGPKIKLTEEETKFGKNEVAKIKEQKYLPVIGIQTTSSTENKNWPKEYWENFISKNKDKYNFIEFLAPKQEPILEYVNLGSYNLRNCSSVIKACDVFIGVDSFGIHAAKAVGRKNSITLFGSSHPLACSYEEFINLSNSKYCQYQPCGRHGYDFPVGCTLYDKSEGIANSCMYAISPKDLEEVVKALKI